MALKLMIIAHFIYVLSFPVPTLYLLYNVELRVYWLKENEKKKEGEGKKGWGEKETYFLKLKSTQRHCSIHKFSLPKRMHCLLATQSAITEFLFELNTDQFMCIKL